MRGVRHRGSDEISWHYNDRSWRRGGGVKIRYRELRYRPTRVEYEDPDDHLRG